VSTAFKYITAAGIVTAEIADGTLKPGALAPSGAALSRRTGYSELTCRKAIRALTENGTLVAGTSLNGRARVPGEPGAGGGDLCAALIARRGDAGLTQAQLAARTGYSLTAVGHAETGRDRPSRRFWERADGALGAGGELLRLYDARSGPVCVLAVWADGSAQVVPPDLAALITPGLRAGPGTGHAVTGPSG
jgi:Helix-turn-helix domain